MITITDVAEYMPDVLNYGIQDFDHHIQRTESDILRLLQVKWWALRDSYSSFDPHLLDSSQFVRASVYHVLGYYIMPIMAKFDPSGDSFREMMNHYRDEFEREFDLVLSAGVTYDANNDGIITPDERAATTRPAQRLTR